MHCRHHAVVLHLQPLLFLAAVAVIKHIRITICISAYVKAAAADAAVRTDKANVNRL